ncbi:PIG-L family deacetylase [Actinoplanes sp. CA-142083]|uniref:PIG-L family deacetylase n=1 Tax=Actinoplanes sp. CA-142083 TaxID=3239903 RepID=UPI003D8BA7F4
MTDYSGIGPVSRLVRREEAVASVSGDEECAAGRSMNVVAHQDDDLLFINPVVSADLAAGKCVVTVYVTAGDAGRARSYWLGREKGARRAYSAMTGSSEWWAEDKVVIGGRSAARFTLGGGRVSLVFLRLPDASTSPGRPVDGLRRLWRGELFNLRTVDDGDRYTRSALLGTLTALMNKYQPDEIRTLDYEGRYGDGDHADHHTVGYFTFAAQRNYSWPHEISGFMGYPVENAPANLGDDARDAKLGYFLAYAPFDSKVCQTARACLGNFYAPRFSRSIRTGD